MRIFYEWRSMPCAANGGRLTGAAALFLTLNMCSVQLLPTTMIATITTFVFQCTSIWNEMLFALVLGGYDSKPATIALNELAGTMAAEFNVQMAGSLILALPVLVLYIFIGKYLISGQMSGAVTAS